MYGACTVNFQTSLSQLVLHFFGQKTGILYLFTRLLNLKIFANVNLSLWVVHEGHRLPFQRPSAWACPFVIAGCYAKASLN
jgi:hypothetical protein